MSSMSEVKNTTNPEEIVKPVKFSKKRRLARVMAIQTIYSIIIQPTDDLNLNKSIYNIIRIYEKRRQKHTTSDEQYLIYLVKGCFEHLTILDQEIQKHLSAEWKLNRIGKVVQTLLRVATFELIHAKDTDAAVIINEYLEIAKYLNHEGEVGFINSVLDKIAKNKIF